MFILLNALSLILTVSFAVYAFRVFKDLEADMATNDAFLAQLSVELEAERTRLTLEGVL